MERDREPIPDEILVVSAILGDLGAFDELAKRYRAAVLRVARTIVGMPEAEDVAQEAWLLAFKALPSIDNPEKFGSWLMVITRNRARRMLTQEKRRSEKQIAVDAFLLEQWGALHTVPESPAEEHEELRLALDSLPEEYSLVLRMRFFDALPLERIGAFLDLPLSTVKWRVFHGKKLLRKKIGQILGSEVQGRESSGI